MLEYMLDEILEEVEALLEDFQGIVADNDKILKAADNEHR